MTFDSFWVALATYFTTVIAGVWTFAWRLSGIKASMDQQIAVLERASIERDSALRREMVEAIDEATRSMGEGMAAIRQKTTDGELWSRDNFVRRTDFQNAFNSFERSIEALRTEMNAGYLRLDGKLDRLLKEQK